MKKFLSDFKKFISRGNILDLAVAVIIGAAFGKIVTSLVNDIVMPLITAIVGKNSIGELVFYVGSSPVMYGNFLQSIIDFIIIAFFIFLIIKIMMKTQSAISEGKKMAKFLGKRPFLKNKEMHCNKKSIACILTINKPEEKKLTTDEILAQILEELKKNNSESALKIKK